MKDRPNAGAAREWSDALLVERVLGGERDLYRVLVERYRESLFRVARAMVLDSDVAEDLVQDAFVRAYVKLAHCRDRSRFRFWLLSTLRHRCLDHLKEKRRRDASLSDPAVRARAAAVDPVARRDLSEQLALRDTIEQALSQLSPTLREAFVLRHVEQHSVKEVAALLGTGVSAVKMRLHRARQQLADWLDEVGVPAAPRASAPGVEARAGEGKPLPTHVTASRRDSSRK